MAAEGGSTPGLSQDFGGSQIESGSGSGGGRGGDIGSHNRVDNSKTVNNTTMNFYGPQIIVNSEGRSLDLDMSDKKKVISYPFHGGVNQQWLVLDDGNGGVALMSRFNKAYVGLESNKPGASLVSSDAPFYWDLSKNQGSYQLGVPNSDLVLNIGPSANLGPPSGKNSQIYILENTPENQAAVKSGKVASLALTPSPKDPPTPASKTGINFNITINDSSESKDAVNALETLQKYFSINGVQSLTISFGHHQIPASVSPGPDSSVPNTSPSTPAASDGAVTTPTSTISPVLSTTGGGCTGFPTGYFRIRAAGPNAYYLTPRFWETLQDGNSIALWTLNIASDAQVFFVNAEGKLCCGGNGAYVDILGNALIVAHNRPPTQPWPNPWSHPLPDFSYSKESRLITVKPYIDPIPSANWPRVESEWKNKQLLVAGQSITATQVPSFRDVSSWAPGSTRTAGRWTIRAGARCEANTWYNLGIEERTVDTRPQDLDRMKWEIEPA